jgi:hypothetical protein
MITRREVAIRLADYLQHRLTLKELVDWAERAMMEEEWEEGHEEVLRDILSRLGLADVEPFALTWEECEDYLSRLGYRVKVEVSEVGGRFFSERHPWVCRRSGFSCELCVIEGRRFGAVGAASAATLCVIEHRRFGFVGAVSVATLAPSKAEVQEILSEDRRWDGGQRRAVALLKPMVQRRQGGSLYPSPILQGL